MLQMLFYYENHNAFDMEAAYMTVRHMKIFLEVYRCGSVTRASQRLHMTQPAVTRAIKELEDYYGVRLFDRIKCRLMVTEAGKALYAQALHIVDLFDHMEKSLRNWDALGVLRIGASVTPGNFLLPDLILRFRSTHPGIKTRVTIANAGRLNQALLDNEMDLALIEGGTADPQLTARPLSSDALALIVPPGHPLLNKDAVRLEDVAEYDLLLREEGSAGRAFLDSVFAVHGLRVQPAWESVSTQALVTAVRKGLGISLLPRKLVEQDIARGAVCTRALEGETLERQNHIVWHKNKYLTKAAEDFIALCQEATP